eukprot:gnl/TRDRNA2_/TRDRNA2_31374_c0_seq1.p1 gnl/TRDRNA2_/TRDRNA2_31374_c0~~gnl/TRDRNA2_/TRDRNA2_31374_c0_seq1.p1  ORF type:complete len:480 (-),score=54.02 gnl/TRDRNA2_/TRDRNA2_31374_c0_seq1:79-1518(-)
MPTGLPLSAAEKRRVALVVSAARCLNALGMGIVVSASLTMLYKLLEDGAESGGASADEPTADAEGGTAAEEAGGSTSVPPRPPRRRQKSSSLARQKSRSEVHRRVQLLSTKIDTAITLLDFAARPLLSDCLDVYGRLPVMVTCQLACAGLRLAVAAVPSVPTYILYRVLIALVSPTFLLGSQAALGDLYGRGTWELSKVSTVVSRRALLCMLFGSFLGRSLKHHRQNYVAGAVLQLCAAATLFIGGRETVEVRRTHVKLSRSSPLSFLAFFRRSKPLVALAALSVFNSLPSHLGIHDVYRRQKFKDWGGAQIANQTIISQTCTFLSTFTALPLMNLLGLQGAARLTAWVQVVGCANNALAPRMEMLYLQPLLSLLMCSGATDRCLQQEAELAGVGQGELGGAVANMNFLPSLVMPNVFTVLYTRCADTLPAAPFLLAAVLHILDAEVAIPLAFRQLSPSVRLAAAPRRRWVSRESMGRS